MGKWMWHYSVHKQWWFECALLRPREVAASDGVLSLSLYPSANWFWVIFTENLTPWSLIRRATQTGTTVSDCAIFEIILNSSPGLFHILEYRLSTLHMQKVKYFIYPIWVIVTRYLLSKFYFDIWFWRTLLCEAT